VHERYKGNVLKGDKMEKVQKVLLGVIIGIVIQIVFVRPACADEVVFTNGDRLTGKILKLVEGKLVFQSDVAGEVTVDVSKIQTFSSVEPIKIHLKNGTILNQKVLKSDPNRFVIEGGNILQAQEFGISAISAINPPIKPEPRWTGNISGGFTLTHGNTNTDSVNASIDLMRRAEKDRILLAVDYARSIQEDPDTGEKKVTENWWKTKAKYDYFFMKNLYGYVDNRYEKDSIANLDRRVIIGVGGGYQWIESDDMNFSTEAGLASLYEKFDNANNSNSEMSMQVGYNFDKKLYKTVKFLHELTYYPSLGNFSDFYLSTSAEFRAYFTKQMFANFKALMDYDATPSPGAGNTDVKYILGVGWSF
jgi:putative salt-induced outer membrane protein YdiY